MSKKNRAPYVAPVQQEETSMTDSVQEPQVEEQGTQDLSVQEPVVEQTAAPVVEEKQPEAPKAPVQASKAEVKQAPAKTPTTLDQLIQRVQESGNQTEKMVVEAIAQYREVMQPGKPVVPANGVQAQYRLWKFLSYLLESAPQEDFRRAWNVLLNMVHLHKDEIFGDRYVYRFSEEWTFFQEELSAYQRLLNILKLTANAQERATGLKQVDLNRSLEVGFSESARQRLVGFYK
jgi:hypothetical protein